MKLTVVDFIYFLKLSLLLREIFASSLDDEECIESEESDYTGENSVVKRTSNKEYTETATSIVYIYSPQTSFNSSMGLGHPTTILIASTHIEVVTITPGLVDSKESYTSELGSAVAQTIPNEVLSKITTICSSCSTSTNNNKNTAESILSIESQSDNSNSAVTFHGSTIAASSAGIASRHSEASNSSSYNPVSTRQTSSIIDQNSCGTDTCLSTNSTSTTTRNVRTSSSASQKLTNSQSSETESSTKVTNIKTTQIQSSSKSSVGTTSYHYFDSAGHQKVLNFPFFFALLLIDYTFF
ncbi:DEHA2D04378p [Debaryomyces hansenii CBS767]|uniref:DEHA2D04378p n=1 Tax=Debaryomyces hansenii (strain ATCC 36239 / CBS 767 / BCRC 21394 / JCM 1990 / NBRC 0083 / IGC 2968) TaxID=284592 RepID=Q6BT13_DEBHA|nr:DEHA2D04378p [Debaryomyces hansenii CBS767]CAG86796.2 DEHA2D04378p [Debaryomyces hansenii CBS767]|eukprot:XP_458657.2 DEHA2D04378p [Debaryomyces hansenii CBS767]